MSYQRIQDLPNGGEMKSPDGRENGGRKMTSGWRIVYISHSISENTKYRGILF